MRGALNSFPSRNLAPGPKKSYFKRPVKHFPFQGQKSHFSNGFSGMVLKSGWRLHSINQNRFPNQINFVDIPAGCSHNRNIDNKRERLILCCDSDFYSVDLESSKFGDELVAVKLNFPTENPDECHGICGPCNGLLLIGFWTVDKCIDYYFVNPSTREMRKLPESPFTVDPDPEKYVYDYGFGYDSSNDDYKVVSISHYDSLGMLADNVVSIYSLRTNSWKKIESSPYHHCSFGHKSGVFVSGALHWVAITDASDFIVALDLADEKFRTVPSPSSLGYNKLTVLGGCLCVSFELYSDSHVEVWVLKEYGISDSWTKFRVNYDYFLGYWKPLCSSRIDRVLFNVKHDKIVLFDQREEKSKELVVHGRPKYFVPETCVESLVSPYRPSKNHINDI